MDLPGTNGLKTVVGQHPSNVRSIANFNVSCNPGAGIIAKCNVYTFVTILFFKNVNVMEMEIKM